MFLRSPNPSGQCAPCSSTECTSCQDNNNFCTKCSPGGPNPSGQCVACNSTGCEECQDNYTICIKCEAKGYYLDGTVCKPCSSNCEECNSTGCILCESDYGKSGVICKKCSDYDTLCLSCFDNYENCEACSEKFGVNLAINKCENCSELNCLKCSTNHLQCSECSSSFGLNLSDPSLPCLDCSQEECLTCPFNYKSCTACTDGYGLFSDIDVVSCLGCFDENCRSCYADYEECEVCEEGFGLKNGGSVGECESCISNCSMCLGSDSHLCSECIEEYFLSESLSCDECKEHCQICINYTICEECQTFYYFNPNSESCSLCHPDCITCDFNLSDNSVQCTNCSFGYELHLEEYPVNCGDICGDFIVLKSVCDNDIFIDYDGCTSECLIEPGFVCEIENNRSICSYSQILEMNITKIEEKEELNELLVVMKVFPPLHVFSTSDLAGVFAVNNENLKIDSIHWNSLLSEFTFSFSLLDDIVNQNIQISFLPNNETDERYFATLDSYANFQVEGLYVQPSVGFQLGPIVKYGSLGATALGWASVGVGLGAKKLAGIELMMVFEVFWSSIVWMNSVFFNLFEQIWPIRYITGYNLPLFKNPSRLLQSDVVNDFNTRLSQSPPHAEVFGIDKENIANNFNISLVLQIIPLVFYAIFVLVSFIMKDKKKKELKAVHELLNETSRSRISDTKKGETETSKITTLRGVSAQLLISLSLLNLANFVSSVIIYIKFSGSRTGMVNIGVMAIGGVVYIITIICFLLDRESFAYFRSSFKPNGLANIHYCFYFLTLISICVLLGLLPQLFWAPLIPPGLFLLFTLITRPYKDCRENVRASVCILVMIFVLGLRVLLSIPSLRSFSFIYFCIILGVLAALSLVTIAVLIYEIVMMCKNKTNIYEEDLAAMEMEMKDMNLTKSVNRSLLISGIDTLDSSQNTKRFTVEKLKDSHTEKKSKVAMIKSMKSNWKEETGEGTELVKKIEGLNGSSSEDEMEKIKDGNEKKIEKGGLANGVGGDVKEIKNDEAIAEEVGEEGSLLDI